MNQITELTRRRFLGNVYTGLGGIGLLLWSGHKLVFRSRIALCCLKKRRRAIERGESPTPCFD